MEKNFCFIVILLLSMECACNLHPNPQKTDDKSAPRVVQAGTYRVPENSIVPPKIIQVQHVKSKLAGKPVVINIVSNVFPVTSRMVVSKGNPEKIIPGKDNFDLAASVPESGISVIASLPEIVIVKDPTIKDNDPDNFSSFQIKQGLKHNIIRCTLQDKTGNLWFGTYGGGATKYDGKYFTHYTTAQGLSNDAVWSMLEDKKGNLWFGTFGGGVNKYDGKYFTRFSKTEGLSDNVYSMLEDKSGNIWFGTEEGVVKYNGQLFTKYTTRQGLGNNLVHCIMEDKSGNIWFGTNGGGACKYDGKSFMNYTVSQGLSNDFVNSMIEDHNGNLWFGTNKGISEYNGKTFTQYLSAPNTGSDVVMSMLEDNNNNLWLGTSGAGLNKFDRKSFTHYSSAQGLSSDFICCMLQDKSGCLWFGTKGGGIDKYDGKLFTLSDKTQGLCNNEVMSILEDKKGALWFGTWGGGVSKYEGNSFINYSTKEGLSNNVVYSILQDKKGNFWFGTEHGSCKYDGKSFSNYTAAEGLTDFPVYKIVEDKNGNFWFCTFGDGIIKFDGKSFTHYTTSQGLSNNKVLCGLEDASGNLWFGTWGGGVMKYNEKYFTQYTTAQGLSNNEIMSMLEDKHGHLWFGTIGGGMNKYDGKSFTYYTTFQGMSNDNHTSALEDKSGNLWFGTRYGLNRMMPMPENKSSEAKYSSLFKSYLVADGFLGVNCFINSILEDSKRNIWIGTGDRLTCYHPEGEIPDTIPPNLQLSNVALFNENINWLQLEKNKDSSWVLGNGVRVGNFKFDSVSRWFSIPENLSLAYNNNYLTFKFIGITTKSPYKVRYRYKLDGLDMNWNSITDQTEAPYGYLPDGMYTFKVKAMNSAGYWCDEINYSFNIRPPWWKKWWFRLSLISAIVVIVYSLYRLRFRQLMRVQNIRNKIAGDLHDDVGSTLSSISIFAELAKKQVKEVSPLLDQIGENSRKMLDSMADIVWAIHPENDSFEKIILRMRSFAYELLGAKNIAFEFIIKESIEKIKLPMTVRKNLYLIFKEATNNMAKYSDATRALFSISYSDHELRFLISDNGNGFDKNKTQEGNGLKNMQRRAREIGGRLVIVSGIGAVGTSVELIIKI